MPATPHIAAVHTLDDVQADALWNWLLERQGLAGHTRLDSVPAIAEAALGLHAARLPSPYATVAARASHTGVPATLFDPATRAAVMTVRCMRKTLHTLPLPLAAAAHAATTRFRVRDALRQITNAGIPTTQVDRATKALTVLLDSDGPTFHRDIETRLARRGTDVATVRLAIKVAWERGVVCYLNQSTGWNREVRTFGLTSAVYPGLDMHQDGREAMKVLIGAYFDRYGPASIRDATWWSALSAGAVTQALADTGRELVQLSTPWTDAPAYMFGDRFEQFASGSRAARSDEISFLAHEDVALKAYYQTRTRYLDGLPQSAVFNQIGEVLPTVMISGRLVGTWSWDQNVRRVEPALIQGRTTPQQRRIIQDHAAELTGTLLRGWHSPRSGRQLHQYQGELDFAR